MRILADENCDRLVVEKLRAAGHDVAYVVEFASGAGDGDLFRRASIENRIVLTDDLDFGRLAERETDHPPGIILMRLDPKETVVAAVCHPAAQPPLALAEDGSEHRFTLPEGAHRAQKGRKVLKRFKVIDLVLR